MIPHSRLEFHHVDLQPAVFLCFSECFKDDSVFLCFFSGCFEEELMGLHQRISILSIHYLVSRLIMTPMDNCSIIPWVCVGMLAEGSSSSVSLTSRSHTWLPQKLVLSVSHLPSEGWQGRKRKSYLRSGSVESVASKWLKTWEDVGSGSCKFCPIRWPALCTSLWRGGAIRLGKPVSAKTDEFLENFRRVGGVISDPKNLLQNF